MDVVRDFQEFFCGPVPGFGYCEAAYLGCCGGVLFVAGVYVPVGDVEDCEPGDDGGIGIGRRWRRPKASRPPFFPCR